MRRLILSLLIIFVLSAPVYAIEEDKINHFGVNVVMTAGGYWGGT